MTLSFRVIAKLCFLMVIIGFCMPMACDANGFQIASGDVASKELSMALYALFISAIIGFVIGVLLLSKTRIPVILDWLVIIVCVLCGSIPFFKNLDNYGDAYQSGIYIINGSTWIKFNEKKNCYRWFDNINNWFDNYYNRRYLFQMEELI